MGMTITLSDDDIDFLDSIYLPSKYPAFSVLPKFMPDEEICRQCLTIALAVKSDVLQFLAVASTS
jgi:hypothetical protein